MPVMLVHQTPTLTLERYLHVVRGLSGKPKLESVTDLPLDGLLMHIAGETDDGLLIVDVFDSQESFERFRELATPFANEAGIEEPPKAVALHTYIAA